MVPCACPGHRVQAPSRSAKALLCHANETLCDAASATQVGPAQAAHGAKSSFSSATPVSEACCRSIYYWTMTWLLSITICFACPCKALLSSVTARPSHPEALSPNGDSERDNDSARSFDAM